MRQSHNSKANSTIYLFLKVQHLIWQPTNEMLQTIKKIALASTKTITNRHKKSWYDEDFKNQRKIMKKQRKEMDQIQGGPTLEGIQKEMK